MVWYAILLRFRCSRIAGIAKQCNPSVSGKIYFWHHHMNYQLPTVHSSYGSGIWVAAGHFISRLSNLKISCPPPAEAVHAAAIPFTEILRGFSSWNPDTSGDARNEKSVMHVPCIRYGLAHDICGTVAVGIETKFWLFCEPMSQSCFQRLFSPRTSVLAWCSMQ